jgi:hypothetical protein
MATRLTERRKRVEMITILGANVGLYVLLYKRHTAVLIMTQLLLPTRDRKQAIGRSKEYLGHMSNIENSCVIT